jgi:ribonucleoside-diphosphate reductase beta chain
MNSTIEPPLERSPRIFQPRASIKPYEYPEVVEFAKPIREAFWTVDHFNFAKDVQDYQVLLTPLERSAIKRTLLAISQVEVKVKEFWGDLYKVFRKSEFNIVSSTFAECESRHMETYSELLERLGLNNEFDHILEVPAIAARVDYISEAMKHASSTNRQQYIMTLTLFSLFIENVSLFSQFAIIKSFSKERNTLKAVDNAVQATQKEELVHGMFGTFLINLVKKEVPEWFGAEFYEVVRTACLKAYAAELNIIDWIFEEGELEFLPKTVLHSFLKKRFNESVVGIGGEPIFDEDDIGDLSSLKWFDEEIRAATHVDFFDKKSPNYAKTEISANDLF